MNSQKPGIEWTHVWCRPGFTSNPVRGCVHRCQWRMPDGTIAICYAKDTAEGLCQAHYPQGFENISFHPDELDAIREHKAPAGIFLDSMSDLFGQAVHAEWISATLETVRKCPQHIFFSLTKNPFRLKHFSPFPENLWVGVSLPPSFMFGKELGVEQQRVWFTKGLREVAQIDASIRWVSLEPLSIDLSEILLAHRSVLDWVVIGAGSDGARTFQPDKGVLQNTLRALSCPVFFKGNLNRTLADEVAGGWREQFPSERD